MNPAAAFQGSARSGDVEWADGRTGFLTESDMAGMMDMLDHIKTNDDEPIILIPQYTRPDEAYPVRVLADEVDMPEDGGYQPQAGAERRFYLKLSVKGVVA